ncbi:MAG TPA: PRC-barrel domain-containing protein [Mycobacteriales bacterium]|jgi:sporulation protein YlmC with PRC-barrel domain|nr:PRC-barrel domain-containing protein [Mycobacteriales bacterium]
MRASDLIGARVRDASGTDIGSVSDVRLVQDGPLLGAWGAALRVDGLVVSPPRTGGYLGYERGTVRGPWAVSALVRWLHRHARYAAWSDVETWEPGAVTLRCPAAALRPVPPLP